MTNFTTETTLGIVNKITAGVGQGQGRDFGSWGSSFVHVDLSICSKNVADASKASFFGTCHISLWVWMVHFEFIKSPY